MTISLKIDNFDALPDGGPLRYQADRRGFEIGRENRDWTLPDPNMFISGRHCEVRYEKDGYWLYDVSRNGTFVNGSSQRVKSPFLLHDGDRIQIGHYFVSVCVDLERKAGEDLEPSPFAAAPSATDNIWDTGPSALPPISRRDLMPPQSKGRRSADFSEQYLELPPIVPGPDFESRHTPAPQFNSSDADPFANRPAELESPFGNKPSPGGDFARVTPHATPARPQGDFPFPFESEPFVQPSFSAPAPAVQGASQQDLPQPARPPAASLRPASSSPVPAGGADAILRSIAVGAGVSPDIFLQREPSDVAAEIGLVLRTVVEELALLLKARAAAKVLARSGNRTMISAVDNNPLKFVPRPEEVLEIMFTRRRAGYLDAKQSIDESFRDLKTHEFATYAAMQTALSRLLDDLSPDAIEKKVSTSAFSSKKGRAWDTFVATWEAKEKPHENGMLDVFLAYFSDAYAKASKPK